MNTSFYSINWLTVVLFFLTTVPLLVHGQKSYDSAIERSKDSLAAIQLYQEIKKAYDTGNWEVAKSKEEPALRIYGKVWGERSAKMAGLLFLNGLVYYIAEDYEKAKSKLFMTVDIYTNLEQPFPDELAKTYHNLALAYQAENDDHSAIEYFLKAIAEHNSNEQENRLNLAETYNFVAGIYLDLSDYDTAIKYYSSALNIYIEETNQLDERISNMYFNIGYCHRHENRLREAAIYFNKELEILEQVPNVDSSGLIQTLEEIAWIFELKENIDGAYSLYQRVLLIKINLFGKESIETANTIHYMGHLMFLKEKNAVALNLSETALAIRQKFLIYTDESIAYSYRGIGLAQCFLNKFQEAEVNLKKSLQIFIALGGDKTIEVADAYINLSLLYFRKKNYSRSLEFRLKTLGIYKEKLDEGDREIGSLYSDIGTILLIKGEYLESIDFLSAALEILQRKDYETLNGSELHEVNRGLSNISNSYQQYYEITKEKKIRPTRS